MLVLTRHENQEILIGEDIRIRVVRIGGRQVRLGIAAPADKRIVRSELVAIPLGGELQLELGLSNGDSAPISTST